MIQGHAHYDAGQVLYQQGANRPFAAVVQTGAVKMVRQEHVIGLALPGDYIGLSCLYEKEQPETAIALTRSRLCLLDCADLLPGHPDAVRLLVKEMGQKRWLTDLQLKSAKGRVCAWLLQLSAHHEQRGLSAQHFRLPLNRTEIASYLGLALETVSRLLSGLNKAETIRIDGREVTILNHADLETLAAL